MTREVRSWGRIPILVLSARGQEADKVAALDAGADDYLTKPFGVGELLARIRVALRHAQSTGDIDPVIELGGLTVDLPRRRVLVNDAEIHLTPTEYKLLTTMASNAGKLLTHRFLLQRVWGPSYGTESHYLRVFMRQRTASA